ncbi:hypothetical protein BWQ93_05990 [Sphingopyxis sp. QXT-31]|nr:hypothetical protein BWQ93_05990 [Sphingopyxis sp. QXT-31]
MPRYFTRPRAQGWVGDDLYDDERKSLRPDLTVDEHVATDTGLLDAGGNTVMRAPNPVGFGRDEEW